MYAAQQRSSMKSLMLTAVA